MTDYQAQLSRSIAELPQNTYATRNALYDQVREHLHMQCAGDPVRYKLERRSLDDTIREIESELSTKEVASIPQGESTGTGEEIPLDITVVAPDNSIYHYGEKTLGTESHMIDSAIAKTCYALRADILSGFLPRGSNTQLIIGRKKRKYEGPLFKCVRRYPILLELYSPVRRHAMSGMKYGIIIGITIHLLLTGYLALTTNLFGRDHLVGLAMIALPICGALFYLEITNRFKLPFFRNIPTVAPLVLTVYISWNNNYLTLLAGVLSAAVLWSGPGMTIGAIVGAIRRASLPRAFDAQPESALAWVAIPLLLSVVVWVVYFFVSNAYLPGLVRSLR